MRKLKASARVWVLVVALVVLAAAAGYYFYTNNKANADVASTTTGSYHFEVVSGNTYTLQSIGNDANSVANSWKIKEAVPMRSGFGLRVRSNSTNQIVTKNLDWAVYSTEGSFPLLQNKSLMAIYPASAGTHQISVQVGTGSNIKKLTLMFSTAGLASVTPSATVTSTSSTGVIFKKNGYEYPDEPVITKLDTIWNESADLILSWNPAGSEPVQPQVAFEDSSYGTVRVPGYSSSGASIILTMSSGKEGTTNLVVNVNGKTAKLPVKMTKNAPSGIIVLQEVDRGYGKMYFRSTKKVTGVGTKTVLNAYWPEVGFGEAPVSSDPSVAEVRMTGSGPGGVGVEVTTKKIGTANIRFIHQADKVDYPFTVQAQP